MKIKSGKIVKTCALGLALLLIGGIGANTLPKTYAEEQSQEQRIIKVHFNVANQGYKVHFWHDGDANGQTRDFDGTDEYGPYININVKNDKTKLNFIIAKIDGNNWGEREYKYKDGSRTIDLSNKNISQIWVESGQEGYKLENPSKPKVDDKTDWAEKINELINKIDDLKLSPREKANLANKLYEIKDSPGKRTAEDYKKAEENFNQKAKEAENNNPGSGQVEISKKPTVEKITKDSTKIKGTGVPKAKIEIYYGFSEVEMTQVKTQAITVDKDGNWSVDKPAYMGIQPGEIIWVIQIEDGKKTNRVSAEIENIRTSDFIKDKIRDIKAKDIRVWKGDTVDWNEAYEIQGQVDDDKYKFINDELKLAIKKDIDKRSSESKGEFKGKIEFTFRDGSKLELDNTLFVLDNIVGSNVEAAADAVTIEIKLGKGVKVKDNPKKIGDEENPVVYETYQVKPGTDINKYKIEILNDTILNQIPIVAQEGYENPKWTSENGSDFKVGADNKVFTAVAEKKPITTKTATKPIKAKVKYQADDSLDFKEKREERAPEDGEEKITTVSEPGKEDVVTKEVIKEAKDGLTKVGNKQVETKKNADGSTTTTTTIYEVDPDTGDLSKPKTTSKTTMPAKSIEDIAKTTKTAKKPIEAKVKYQADDSLDFKEKREERAPEDGEEKITTVSEPGKEDVVTKEVIKEAKDGLTKVGNKQVETKKNADGSTTTTTTTYQVDPDTGELTNPNKTIKTSMPAGTIEDIAKTTKIERKTIPGKVTYEADESLNFKEKKEETTPVDGEKEITIVSHPGKKDIVTEKTIKEAKDGLTKVGNKKVETKTNADGSTTTTTTIYKVNPDTGKLENPTSTRKTSMPAGTIEDIAKTRKVTTKKVPGKVRYQADENVEFGQQKVEKAPVDGEKEITTVSQPGKEDEVIEKTIKEAKDGLTKVGNKQVETKENADGSTTTITTIYEVNPKTGKLENPTTTTEKTEPEQPSEPSKQEYQLIFNGNAGSPASQRIKVKDGEKIEGVKEPTRDGYKFIKWVILGTDKTFDLNDKFNKDVLAKDDKVLMLTAVWEKVEKDTKPGKDLEEKPGKKDPEKEKPGKKDPEKEKPGKKDSEKEKPSKSKKDRDDDYYWVYDYLRANNFKGLGKTSSQNPRLKRNYDALKKAYNKNLITSKAARYLLDKYPETVKPVRHELEKLLQRSEILRKEAYELLKKLENCYDY